MVLSTLFLYFKCFGDLQERNHEVFFLVHNLCDLSKAQSAFEKSRCSLDIQSKFIDGRFVIYGFRNYRNCFTSRFFRFNLRINQFDFDTGFLFIFMYDMRESVESPAGSTTEFRQCSPARTITMIFAFAITQQFTNIIISPEPSGHHAFLYFLELCDVVVHDCLLCLLYVK